MTAPRLEVDLGKIYHNALELVNRLRKRGISVSGVTKAMLGSPDLAKALLAAGVSGLADSRIENIQTMRHAAPKAPMTLIRTPMISQVALVVESADISLNSELDIISELSKAAGAAERMHEIILMVELGDLREGIMPPDLEEVVRQTLRFPHITLKGIGTNLACRCGVVPDELNMGRLSALADEIEATFGPILDVVSGGNSANLEWALSSASVGRINNLRLGEAILLGREPLHRQPIEGLYIDAITLVAEVIEAKIKPSQPWGEIGETAFGVVTPAIDSGSICQAILAVGQMDTDSSGLTPPEGIHILGSSSDHLVVDCGKSLPSIGSEMAFGVNYSALIRAMASPLVAKKFRPLHIFPILEE
ncbi:MAG: alanine/ornithine racemase family PLP-dependent enzyme [Rhodospirillales bacterium]|nr:alanine/ornithine racemase family PLP-dependent enzyme [Rhodospirillales bacterium]